MTVLDIIKRSAEFLDKKGVESPRLNVELLLAHLLGLPRMGLYLNFGRELTPMEMDGLRELVRRRGAREPLQHILGSTSFCGLDLAVNPNVLIPRPETELLAELGWEFLISGEKESSDTPICESHALDFGTGSGCLAILLAVKCPGAKVVALDISADALILARQNAATHHVKPRILFVQGDGFSALDTGMLFHLIISNPPYIPTEEIPRLQIEVMAHDPRLALDGGADGLDFYRRLAVEAGAFLAPNGRLMIELGDGQSAAVREIFESQKWIVESVKLDYSKHPRVLIAHASQPKPGFKV